MYFRQMLHSEKACASYVSFEVIKRRSLGT